MLNHEELASLYNASEYSILTQYEKNEQFVAERWIDIFTLIRYGHYDVTSEQIDKALQIFNRRFDEHITDINNLTDIDSSQQYARLIERITFMKQEAIDFCIKRKE